MTQSQNADDMTSRKGEHIKWCLDENSQSNSEPFAMVQLPYHALPDIDMAEVSTDFTLFGKKLSQPLIISSMTGGTEHGNTINTNLAKAAEACQVALGVGSQRIGLEKPEALETFKLIRKHAPTTFIIANMGAVQLNYGHKPADYQKVVDMVEANALYLHINPLQEAIQPGGDTNFKALLPKIAEVVRAVKVPVLVKEVGHGIDEETAKSLLQIGVQGIDVAGVGGTSYAWVEGKRARNEDYAEWFKQVGVSTEDAVRSIAPLIQNDMAVLIASGGVRNPIQGHKAHLLGADMFASTQPFLSAAMESDEAVIAALQKWQKALQISLFVAGQKTW
jgi:isopentenyl-diphosphate delta-isomerase